MELKQIKDSAADFVPSYILAVLLKAVYVNLRGPTGQFQAPRISAILVTLPGLLVHDIVLGVIVLVVALFLRRFSSRFNWIIAGVSVGITYHVGTIILWSISGASGTQIATYSTLLGTGLITPLILGFCGQLFQRLKVRNQLRNLI